MKNIFRTKALLPTACLSLFLFSCTKENKCPTPGTIEIENNGPIVEGWPLHLESVNSMGHKYKWSGPNGWEKNYNYISNSAFQQSRFNMTKADAGEYTLRLIDLDGCEAYRGTANIQVIEAPKPPCMVTANTSTSSVIGVGDYNFVRRTFSGSGGGDYYFVTGYTQIGAGGHSMRMAFFGDHPPIPGVYKTSGYFGNADGEVGLYIGAGPYEFLAKSDQKVYVNRVNNKLEVSFCSLSFFNELNPPSPITISARIVEP